MGEIRKNRTHKLSVRLDDSELETLRKKAGDQALAEWLRNVGLGVDLPIKRIAPKRHDANDKTSRPTKKIDPSLIRHLSAIGNNINQIARAVNQNPNADTLAVILETQKINEALNLIVEKYAR